MKILCGIMSVPHNIVMDLNHIMHLVQFRVKYRRTSHTHVSKWPLRSPSYSVPKASSAPFSELIGTPFFFLSFGAPDNRVFDMLYLQLPWHRVNMNKENTCIIKRKNNFQWPSCSLAFVSSSLILMVLGGATLIIGKKAKKIHEHIS